MPHLTNCNDYKTSGTTCIKEGANPSKEAGGRKNLLGGSSSLPPLAPASTQADKLLVKHKVLSLSERVEIQAGLRANELQSAIAKRLSRSAGTISEELKRNGGAKNYDAIKADKSAYERRRASRIGDCKITEHSPLRDEVHARLRRHWTPEEIAGKLKEEYPELPLMHISHETIYRYVYVVARGALQKELAKCLRRGHKTRKPRRRGALATQGKIPDMPLVDTRPPEVESRLIAGHYEGDLIQGEFNRSAVGVLVERTTRYTFLCHLPQKDAETVREAFTRRLAPLPAALRRSLTYDQGKEMAQHKTLAADLGIKVFFCHPHSPWERGTCESQNGRIRHYLPKGTDLSKVSPQQLRAYQDMLNERPRKILGGRSPAECFQELISKHSSN